MLPRADDSLRLRRAGLHGAFGCYVAELPPQARAVTATAFDATGARLATDGYRRFRDLRRGVFTARRSAR